MVPLAWFLQDILLLWVQSTQPQERVSPCPKDMPHMEVIQAWLLVLSTQHQEKVCPCLKDMPHMVVSQAWLQGILQSCSSLFLSKWFQKVVLQDFSI